MCIENPDGVIMTPGTNLRVHSTSSHQTTTIGRDSYCADIAPWNLESTSHFSGRDPEKDNLIEAMDRDGI